MATIPWAATGQKLEASAEQHCRIWLRTIDSWSEFYCNCLLQTAACCWKLCSRESGETSKMMPLPAVKTKTMSWKTLKHWGRRVISEQNPSGTLGHLLCLARKLTFESHWWRLTQPMIPKRQCLTSWNEKKQLPTGHLSSAVTLLLNQLVKKKINQHRVSGVSRWWWALHLWWSFPHKSTVSEKTNWTRFYIHPAQSTVFFNILCNYHSRNHWWHFACNILACTTLDKWAKSVLSVIGALADFGPISARVFLPFYSSTLQTNWSGDC